MQFNVCFRASPPFSGGRYAERSDPNEKNDANTRSVFGDYISIYGIQRAVEDKATVPIYYEGRLAKLELKAEERPKIDPNFEETTEGEELEHKEKLKTKWAALEAVGGAEKRISLIAEDFVKHTLRADYLFAPHFQFRISGRSSP